MFPAGIYYNHKNNAVRTERVNLVFELIRRLSDNLDTNKKGQTLSFLHLSPSADSRGQSSNFLEDLLNIDRFGLIA
jgi:hypothetical protein